MGHAVAPTEQNKEPERWPIGPASRVAFQFPSTCASTGRGYRPPRVRKSQRGQTAFLFPPRPATRAKRAAQTKPRSHLRLPIQYSERSLPIQTFTNALPTRFDRCLTPIRQRLERSGAIERVSVYEILGTTAFYHSGHQRFNRKAACLLFRTQDIQTGALVNTVERREGFSQDQTDIASDFLALVQCHHVTFEQSLKTKKTALSGVNSAARGWLQIVSLTELEKSLCLR